MCIWYFLKEIPNIYKYIAVNIKKYTLDLKLI